MLPNKDTLCLLYEEKTNRRGGCVADGGTGKKKTNLELCCRLMKST